MLQSNNNTFDIRHSRNSDTVIGFTSVKAMKNANFLDASKVSAYLMDGENSHQKHLGMIDLFQTTHNVGVPFMRDLLKGAAVLEVGEGESITYDLPVNNKEMQCFTAQDTSGYTDYPGIDGNVFKLILNFEFSKGDVLTYDPQYGAQVMVSSDHEVERVGENFLHHVILLTNDKEAYFPKEWLQAGKKWMKIDNRIAEFDEGFSGINMITNPAGSLRNEFILGSPRGVETFMTAKAARMKSPGLNNFTDAMQDKVQKQLEALGGAKEKGMFFYGKANERGVVKDTMKVGTTLEYLALMELAQMECYSLLFSKAATVQTSKGVKRTNEGVWHQIRRGKRISYARPGGITKDHIQEAAQYVFGNTDIRTLDRTVKFKAGYFAYQNVMQIFREEAIAQLGALPAGMVGVDKQTQDTVFKGPLNNLELQAVIINTVTIPGIGRVIVEHDPSLDYQPLADRFSAGMFGEGFAHTAYSLVMWDVTDPEYSNVSKVKNASVIKGGNSKANIYYVKPEEGHLVYGYNHGRMAFQDNPFDVMATSNHMGSTFWAYSQSGALVLDTTRYVVIELDLNNRIVG